MTKEEIIQGALDCYGNCKIIINSLCLNVKDVLKDEGFYSSLSDEGKEIIDHYRENFSVENELVIFDYVLQALLLCQAVVDGDFCEAEKELIMALAKDNDFMDTFEGLDWETVYAADQEKQQEIVELTNQYLNEVTDAFVDPLALLDAFTTQNVLLDLSSQLSIISSLLGEIDGEFTEDEKEAFETYANELILGKWADIKGLVAVEE